MSLPILSPAALGELESSCHRRLGPTVLMSRAGTAIARAVAARARPGARVIALCGPGDNGGDGYAAAAELTRLGFAVSCAAPAGTAPRGPAGAAMYAAWREAGGTVVEDPAELGPAEVVIDALFGTGLRRPLGGVWLEAAQWYNERPALRLSVDVPSGIDGQTGRPAGHGAWCRSHLTVSMLTAKPGCYMNEGVTAAGETVIDDLSVSVPLSDTALCEESDLAPLTAPRQRHAHKGDFGRVLVLGGAAGTVGAVILAGRAALRLGAGAVTVAPLSADVRWDPVCPELMFSAAPELERYTAIAAGCGLGQDENAARRLDEVLDRPVPLLLDADAVRLLARRPDFLERVLGRTAPTVLTPHPGEAAELLARGVGEINDDRLAAARALALRTGAVCLLKGAGTVVATRSGRTWLVPRADPALATAGSGDTLSGMIISFLAQGYDTIVSVLGAAWLHAGAAEGRTAGLIASEIPTAAARELDRLRRARAAGAS